MFKTVEEAFWLTLKNRPLVFLTYALNLLLGLVIAAFFYEIAVTQGGGSPVLDKLIADFDYMTFSDFLRVHGSSFTPVWFAVLLLGGLSFLINTVLVGGTFHQYKYGETSFNLREIFKSGFLLFGKYILLAIIVLVIGLFILLISGILIFAAVNIAKGGNERTYIFWLIPPAMLLVLMWSNLIVISDYTRYLLFENTSLNPFSGFGEGFSYVFKNFRTVGLYWLFLTGGVFTVLIYLMLDSVIGMKGEFTIFLMIVFQQIVSFVRAFLKNWHYAIVHTFYQSNPVLIMRSNSITAITEEDDDDEKLSEVD